MVGYFLVNLIFLMVLLAIEDKHMFSLPLWVSIFVKNVFVDYDARIFINASRLRG